MMAKPSLFEDAMKNYEARDGIEFAQALEAAIEREALRMLREAGEDIDPRSQKDAFSLELAIHFVRNQVNAVLRKIKMHEEFGPRKLGLPPKLGRSQKPIAYFLTLAAAYELKLAELIASGEKDPIRKAEEAAAKWLGPPATPNTVHHARRVVFRDSLLQHITHDGVRCIIQSTAVDLVELDKARQQALRVEAANRKARRHAPVLVCERPAT